MRIILYDGGKLFNLMITVTILEQSDVIITSILVAILSLVKLQFYMQAVQYFKMKKHFPGFGFVLLTQKSKNTVAILILHALSSWTLTWPWHEIVRPWYLHDLYDRL